MINILINRKKQKELQKTFKKYDVEFAYLFGSRANGKFHEKSDYDIAINLPKKFDDNQRFNIRLRLMSELFQIFSNKKVDVIILNDISSILFKYVIFYEGKNIYEANQSARLDYENLLQGEYFDFSPFLDEYNKLYAEKILKSHD